MAHALQRLGGARRARQREHVGIGPGADRILDVAEQQLRGERRRRGQPGNEAGAPRLGDVAQHRHHGLRGELAKQRQHRLVFQPGNTARRGVRPHRREHRRGQPRRHAHEQLCGLRRRQCFQHPRRFRRVRAHEGEAEGFGVSHRRCP
jgi:hypothetical protein